MSIDSWKKFSKKVRKKGCVLLKKLDNFYKPVLVTGCQRSGTTIVARIIRQSEGMVDFQSGKDDELDGALILSGMVHHHPQGRYCFQTTYLNECVEEYFEHRNGVKIVWVLRNPFSVVYSMLHNWSTFALNELFFSCGRKFLTPKEEKKVSLFGKFGISRLRKACYAYVGKTEQAFILGTEFSKREIKFIEYNDLIVNKAARLPELYDFINLKYYSHYSLLLHAKSLHKAANLNAHAKSTISTICMPIFKRALSLIEKHVAIN